MELLIYHYEDQFNFLCQSMWYFDDDFILRGNSVMHVIMLIHYFYSSFRTFDIVSERIVVLSHCWIQKVKVTHEYSYLHLHFISHNNTSKGTGSVRHFSKITLRAHRLDLMSGKLFLTSGRSLLKNMVIASLLLTPTGNLQFNLLTSRFFILQFLSLLELLVV